MGFIAEVEILRAWTPRTRPRMIKRCVCVCLYNLLKKGKGTSSKRITHILFYPFFQHLCESRNATIAAKIMGCETNISREKRPIKEWNDLY